MIQCVTGSVYTCVCVHHAKLNGCQIMTTDSYSEALSVLVSQARHFYPLVSED